MNVGDVIASAALVNKKIPDDIGDFVSEQAIISLTE